VAMDAAGLSATSAVVNVTVSYVPPTVSLTNPATGSSYPAPASIPLSASASSPDGTITNVAFYQGTTLLANVTTAPFSYTWASVNAGSYNLTAQATDSHGLSVTSSVVAITVTNGYGLPVVSLTSPANNATYTPGSSVALAATATESGGTITNVAFYSGSTLLANVAGSPYDYTWASVPLGSYALTAVASDASGNAATSSVVNITVANVHVPPSVTLTNPVNNAVLDVATGLVISATASSSSGTITNVAFYQNTFLLGNVTTAPYTFDWTNALTGDYTLTAVAKDNSGFATTSSVVNVIATNSIEIATIRQIKTVFVIPLENHDLVQASPDSSPEQLLGNPACPYFNSLITPGNSNAVYTSYATHYLSCAINGEHPSEPNYLWSEAGTDFGIRTDDDPSTSVGNVFSNVFHLSGQLTTAGIAWRSYQEDLQYSSSELVSASGSTGSVNPYNGTTEYSYAVKHNPMAFYTDTQNKNVYPMTNFWSDLTNNNIGRYNWITPDQYNEMHSSLPSGYTYNGVAYSGDQAAIAEGDNALSIIVPKIMASQAYKDHGVIIIWTDETESTDDTNTTLPYVIISSMAKGNAYASTLPYSHSSDLKTMDELFGLAYQTNTIPGYLDAQNTGTNYVNGQSAAIYDLSDFFVSVSVTALTSSANPSGFGSNVTFTAQIKGSDTPTGTVQFATNGVAIGAPVALNNGVASLSTSALPVGANIITATYSGDANNQPSTNSLTQTVTNVLVAGPAYYSRAAGVSLLININNLLTNVYSSGGYPITLVGAGTDGQNLLTTNGATLFNNGTYLLYTNSIIPNVNDSFLYTVTDGQGDTNEGTISIIMNNNVVGQSNVRLTVGSSSVTANFFGVPGFMYIVDRSTNLTAGEGWVPISTNTAPTNGLIQIQDNFLDLGIPIPPVPSPVYYRLQYNP
jgi:phosphatidylinositol-3-phosphatase